MTSVGTLLFFVPPPSSVAVGCEGTRLEGRNVAVRFEGTRLEGIDVPMRTPDTTVQSWHVAVVVSGVLVTSVSKSIWLALMLAEGRRERRSIGLCICI